MTTSAAPPNHGVPECFLSELIGTKVYNNGKKIGKLGDVVVVEREKIPEMTHIEVDRPFGDPSLMVPVDEVRLLSHERVEIAVDPPSKYARQPREGEILLKDHVLDKKVLDTEGKEVEIVYDIKLSFRNGKYYVVGVDLSRYGLLRRIGLKGLSGILRTADRDESQIIPWTYILPLPTDIGSFKGAISLNVLKEEMADMHPVDLADVLETMEPEYRAAILEELDAEHASDTLEEIDPNVQRDLILHLTKGKVAELINDMTPGQAADILSVLPSEEREKIVRLLASDTVVKVQAIIDQQDENIMNYTTTEFLKFPPGRTVAEATSEYHTEARGKEAIMYLYVVDPENGLLGVIDLKELLLANDEDLLKDIMTESVVSLKPHHTLKKASELFRRYGFRAIPVIDDDGRILGAVMYRDILNLKHRFLG